VITDRTVTHFDPLFERGTISDLRGELRIGSPINPAVLHNHRINVASNLHVGKFVFHVGSGKA
jgi:hypothetical protein